MVNFSVPLVLILALAATDAAGDQDEREIALHAEFLNSEDIGTRLPGEPGLDVAARYIAVQLERFGYRGAGPDGSFFEASSRDLVRPGPGCLVAARWSDSSRVLRPNDDFVPFAWSATGEREGAVSLLGPGGDPGRGPDVAGRVVVWAGAPRAGLRERVERAAEKGALAVLVAPDPRTETVDVVVFKDGRREPGSVVDRGREFDFSPLGGKTVRRLTLAEVDRILLRVPAGPPIGSPPWPAPLTSTAIPVIAISGRAARAILGRPIGRMLEALDDSGREGPVAVGEVRVRLAVDLARETLTVRHVTGILAAAEGGEDRPPVVLEARYDGESAAGRTAALVLDAARILADLAPTARPMQVRFRARPPLEGPFALAPGAGPDERDAAVEALLLATAGPDPVSPDPDAAPGNPPAPSDPAPPPPTRDASRAARLTGHLDRARAAIEGALAASPEDLLAHLEQGRVRLALGDIEGVRESIETLRRLAAPPVEAESEATPPRNPDAGLADLLLAELLFSEGGDAGAKLALGRAAQSGLAEAIFEIARNREVWDSPMALRQAVEELEGILPGLGESARGDCVRGILSIWGGRSLVARQFFTRAIEKDPLFGLAYFYRAGARLSEPHELDAAIEDCNRAMEVGLEEPDLWFHRGMAHLLAKRFTPAIRDFGIRAEKDPGSVNGANAVYNIACAYALMGNREEALDWLGLARTRGFVEVGHARVDPDLASIRDDPRFEKILESKPAE